MRVTRLFTGADGESHFEDLDVPLADAGAIGLLSETLPATGVLLRETPGDYDYGWHNAPQRQLVVTLSGDAVDITVGGGETRRFGPGDILLAEDTTGHGHESRAVHGRPRISLFVLLGPRALEGSK